MICFEGVISKDTRKQIIIENCKALVWLSAFMIILGLLSIFGIIGFKDSFAVGLSIIWMILCFILAVLAFFIPFIDIKKEFLTKIEISDGYLTCYFNTKTALYGKSVYRNLEYVNKVVDYGNYYLVCFSFLHRFIGCICQKDLITQGTIEEFEELFEDKIERRIK